MAIPADARRVLVVEDDDNIADLLLLVLEAEGYAAVRAGDGELALAIADTMQPQLILLDMMLPGMQGLEFARRYRDSGGEAAMIAVTAFADTRIARHPEIAAVVRKPFEIEALLSLTAEILARQDRSEA